MTQAMSKTILTQVDGFTPLPDLLVTRYGLMTAAVWGKMWRYCQGKDGVCRAKLERIAKELNVSRMTIIRHIDTLVADGFMKDTTPNLKNRPHIYADTGKVAMYNKFGMSVTVTESYSRVTESDSQSNIELLEDSIEDSNKETGADAPTRKPATLEEAIYSGQPITEDLLEDKLSRMKDAANLIDMGCPGAGELAFAFMDVRGIVFPNSKVKGQRKAAREMLEMGVRPEHVREATKQLLDKQLTVVDLFGVSKTAINLATLPEDSDPAADYPTL